MQTVGETMTPAAVRAVVQQPTPALLVDNQRFSSLMGAYDSIYAASFRFAQYNPDLLTTQKGYDTFDKMLTMAACRAPFNVKRHAILSDMWVVKSAIQDAKSPDFGKAAELAKYCEHLLANIEVDATDHQQDFRSVLFELLRACWDGFHVTECIWKIQKSGPFKGKIGLEHLASKPAKEIGFDLDLNTLAAVNIKPYTPLTGYSPAVPIEKVLLYTYAPQHGLPYGMGDARAAYKHYWILDSLLQFWAIAAERWGTPVMVVKYPAGDLKALADAQAAVDRIRQGSAPIFPANIEYEMVKIDAGTLDVFKSKADWHVAQIAQNILGNTLTTGEGERSGSMALGQVHEKTQGYSIDYVRRDIEGVVNRQLLRRAVRYSYGDNAVDLCPTFALGDSSPSDMLAIAQACQILVSMGNMPNRSGIIRELMNITPISPEEEKDLDNMADVNALAAKSAVTGTGDGAKPSPSTPPAGGGG